MTAVVCSAASALLDLLRIRHRRVSAGRCVMEASTRSGHKGHALASLDSSRDQHDDPTSGPVRRAGLLSPSRGPNLHFGTGRRRGGSIVIVVSDSLFRRVAHQDDDVSPVEAVVTRPVAALRRQHRADRRGPLYASVVASASRCPGGTSSRAANLAVHLHDHP